MVLFHFREGKKNCFSGQNEGKLEKNRPVIRLPRTSAGFLTKRSARISTLAREKYLILEPIAGSNASIALAVSGYAAFREGGWRQMMKLESREPLTPISLAFFFFFLGNLALAIFLIHHSSLISCQRRYWNQYFCSRGPYG